MAISKETYEQAIDALNRAGKLVSVEVDEGLDVAADIVTDAYEGPFIWDGTLVIRQDKALFLDFTTVDVNTGARSDWALSDIDNHPALRPFIENRPPTGHLEAEPGEVWVFTKLDGEEFAIVVERDHPWELPTIVNSRRIWPLEAS